MASHEVKVPDIGNYTDIPVIEVLVKPGDPVKKGDTLLIMEAMKMENNIFADKEGKVASVHVREGDTVLQNDTLIEVESI